MAIDRYDDDLALGANGRFPSDSVRAELERLEGELRRVGESLGVYDTGWVPVPGDRDHSEPISPGMVERSRNARGGMMSDESSALIGLTEPLPEWFLGSEPPYEWRARPWVALARELALLHQPEGGRDLMRSAQALIVDLNDRVRRARELAEWIKPKGRPRNTAAKALAFRLSFLWSRRAGLPMQRDIAGGGAWVDFVRSVFEAARVRSSGQRYARELQQLTLLDPQPGDRDRSPT